MYEVEVTWEELVEEFQKIPEEMLLEEVEQKQKVQSWCIAWGDRTDTPTSPNWAETEGERVFSI